jgi:hypothetical protein
VARNSNRCALKADEFCANRNLRFHGLEREFYLSDLAMGVRFQKLVRRGFLKRCPTHIKDVAKMFLNPDAVYDKRLLALGLDRIYPTDMFLCSYPKSGNTWVRFLIGNLLYPDIELTFRNIGRYVPGMRCPYDLNALTRRPIMKTHWPFFSYFPRVIYIHRDPRDVLLSHFYYSTANGWFEGNYSEFVRLPAPDRFGTWNEHICGAFDFAAGRPTRILILKYEDLLQNAQREAGRLAAFLGLAPPPSELQRAVEKSDFTKLREMETKFGPEAENRAAGFFRKGIAGQWRDQCSDDDIRFIQTICEDGMRAAGYTQY